MLAHDGSAVQDATKKECGLHSGNVAGAGSNGAEARTAERDLWHDAIVEPLSRQQLESLADGPRDKNTLVVLYAPWCPFSQVRLAPLGDMPCDCLALGRPYVGMCGACSRLLCIPHALEEMRSLRGLACAQR